MRVISGAASILVSAEEVSVGVICVAAVSLVSAGEVSLRVICVAVVEFWCLQRKCLFE